MEEFDENKKIYYAKELIDKVPIQLKYDNDVIASIPTGLKYHDKDTILTYKHAHLPLLLVGRHYVSESHPRRSELSQDEIIVRTIFDALLNFFGKLGYLSDIGVITNKELGYFVYYIESAKHDWAVSRFARDLNYELYAILLERMGIISSDLLPLVESYRKRTKNKHKVFKVFKLGRKF
jgi:hypothetical protein